MRQWRDPRPEMGLWGCLVAVLLLVGFVFFIIFVVTDSAHGEENPAIPAESRPADILRITNGGCVEINNSPGLWKPGDRLTLYAGEVFLTHLANESGIGPVTWVEGPAEIKLGTTAPDRWLWMKCPSRQSLFWELDVRISASRSQISAILPWWDSGSINGTPTHGLSCETYTTPYPAEMPARQVAIPGGIAIITWGQGGIIPPNPMTVVLPNGQSEWYVSQQHVVDAYVVQHVLGCTSYLQNVEVASTILQGWRYRDPLGAFWEGGSPLVRFEWRAFLPRTDREN